jgi:hypothetical protein
MLLARPLALLALASATAAAQVKLNPPLARDPAAGGDLLEFAFSSDGAFLVMRGDQRAGVFELHRAPSDGSAPAVRLHPELPDWADVTTGGALDAGGRVLFLGDLELDERHELWSVPAAGGGPLVRLSALPVAGGDVESFRLTSDGLYAVYRADQDADERLELYRVLTDGSAAPVRLNPPLDPLGDVIAYQLSADGARVVYRADQDTNLVNELYAVRLDTPGVSSKLSAPMPPGAGVSDFRLGAGSDVVLFRVTLDGTSALWSAPLDGSAPAQLVSGGITAGQDVMSDYAVGADGEHAVYRVAFGDLYSAALAAPAPVRLSDPTSFEVATFALSEDGATVVFHDRGATDDVRSVAVGGGTTTLLWSTPELRGSLELLCAGALAVVTVHDVDDGDELFTVPLDGSAPPVGLAGLPNPAHLQGVQIVGDEVLFRRSQPEFGLAYRLLAAPLDGSAPARELNAPVASGGVGTYRVDPAGARVAYLAAEAVFDRIDLNTRPIDASQPSVRVSPPLDPGPIAGDVSLVAGTSDGRYAVYLATQDDYQSVELYSVDLEAEGLVRKLSPPVASGRDVRLVALAPDDARVVFCGDLDLDSGEELYVAPLDGGAPAQRLAGHAFAFFQPASFSADGLRAVYLVSGGLWTVPLDGSAAPVRISTGAAGNVGDFALAGTRAAFRTVAGGPRALYSAPLDGGAAPVLLQAAGTSDVTSYRVAADASCVVFVADAESDGVFELFRVPLAGGAPVKLNPALPPGGDVIADFQLDPATGRVVYAADGQTDEKYELYSVPLDGSGSASVISGALVAGGDVTLQLVTPSGRALYVADALVNGRFELFSVPADGSASPLVISGVLPTGADVSEFGPVVLAPGERVVYRATWGPSTVLGIFVTRADGGMTPGRLDGGLTGGATANTVGVAGTHVFFRSNQRNLAQYELLAVSLGGLPQPSHLHAPLVAGGNVGATAVAGDRLLYLADAEMNDVTELYLARLPRPPAHGGAAAPTTTRTLTRYP